MFSSMAPDQNGTTNDIESGSNSSNNNNGLLNPINESTSLLSPDSTRSIRALPGMLIRAHGIDPQRRTIRHCPTKEALSKKQQQKNYYWIDIDADSDRDRDELNEWLQTQLLLSNFLLSRLAEPSQTWASQVISLPSAVLAVIRILPEHEASEDITFMAALSMPRLLLTFTSGPRSQVGALYGKALSYIHARGEKLVSSADALYAWLLFHVERTSRAVRNLRYHVLRMDEAMDRDIKTVSIQEIISAKDHLLNLMGVAEEQNESLEALAACSPSDVLKFEPGTLSIVTAQAAATERTALRLEKQLGDLRQRHESYLQERMNRRLAVLTVCSAVFLPLTLITGIWGMNFEHMPELQGPEAYPVALMFMFLLATSMLCYFWRSGWFD